MPHQKRKIPTDLKAIVLNAGVMQEGHFVFANGGHGLVKIEMDRLWDDEVALQLVLERLAHPELPPTDLIMGVPSGGQLLAEALITRGLLDVPFARLERIPGGGKKDFRFVSEEDFQKALTAQSPRIYEDVVSTMSSIAGVTKLLDSSHQIQVASIWRRGEPLEEYSRGILQAYLIEEVIPIYEPGDCPECTK